MTFTSKTEQDWVTALGPNWNNDCIAELNALYNSITELGLWDHVREIDDVLEDPQTMTIVNHSQIGADTASFIGSAMYMMQRLGRAGWEGFVRDELAARAVKV